MYIVYALTNTLTSPVWFFVCLFIVLFVWFFFFVKSKSMVIEKKKKQNKTRIIVKQFSKQNSWHHLMFFPVLLFRYTWALGNINEKFIHSGNRNRHLRNRSQSHSMEKCSLKYPVLLEKFADNSLIKNEILLWRYEDVARSLMSLAYCRFFLLSNFIKLLFRV